MGLGAVSRELGTKRIPRSASAIAGITIMNGAGRGRGMTTPAWMQNEITPPGPPPPAPPKAPGSMSSREEEIDQIAIKAVLEQQEAEMRFTLAQQRYINHSDVIDVYLLCSIAPCGQDGDLKGLCMCCSGQKRDFGDISDPGSQAVVDSKVGQEPDRHCLLSTDMTWL